MVSGRLTAARGYSSDALNRYTQIGAITPSYDVKGNLTQASSLEGNAATFAYNVNNALVTSSNGTQLYQDPLGRTKLVGNGASWRGFEFDGNQMVTERRSSDQAIMHRYVFGPGEDEPLIWYDYTSGSAVKKFLIADERGSIVAVTSSSGAVLATNSYDEYGIPASGNVGMLQYTGQAWLPEIGMYYYKARVYSPTLGRFMQTDPIGYADGMNWYNYVGGDPVNNTDPSGLAGDCPSGTLCGTYDGPDIVVTARPSSDTSTNIAGVIVSAVKYGLKKLKCLFGGCKKKRKAAAAPAVAETEPQSKKISACMQNFIGSQGYNTDGLNDVTFYKGSLTAEAVRGTMGNPAITIGNSIHVASDSWSRISSPSDGATYFEEIIHTRQYQSWGKVGFAVSYLGVAAPMGYFQTGDAHNNPIENQAIALSNKLLDAYRALPKGKQCGD